MECPKFTKKEIESNLCSAISLFVTSQRNPTLKMPNLLICDVIFYDSLVQACLVTKIKQISVLNLVLTIKQEYQLFKKEGIYFKFE